MVLETPADDLRIQYSGKGAGASAMLMSTMGPMGVAVGIAIDEGIGKDINEAFIDKGLSHSSLVLDSVQEGLKTRCAVASDNSDPLCSAREALVLNVDKLAFAAAQDSDFVTPDIVYELSSPNSTHSSDTNGHRWAVSSKDTSLCKEMTAALEVVKRDGEPTASLLRRCIVELLVRPQ